MKALRGILIVGFVAASTGACSGGSFFGGAGASAQKKDGGRAHSADAAEPLSIEDIQNMPAQDYFEQTNAKMQELVGDEEYLVGGIIVSNLASTYSEVLEKALDLGLEDLTVKDLMGTYTEEPSDDEFLVAVEEVYGKAVDSGSADVKLRLSWNLLAGGSAGGSAGKQTGGAANGGKNSPVSADTGASTNPNVAAFSGMQQETGKVFQQKAYASETNVGAAGGSKGGSFGKGGFFGLCHLGAFFEALRDYFEDHDLFGKEKYD